MTKSAFLETLRISGILLRYRWTAFKSLLSRSKPNVPGKKRQANKRKSRISKLLLAVLFLYLALIQANQGYWIISGLTDEKKNNEHFEKLGLCQECPDEAGQALSELLLSPSPVYENLPLIYWLGLMLCIWVLVVASAGIYFSRIGQKSEDSMLDWVATFPIRLRPFLLGQILAESFMNVFIIYFVLPVLLALAVFRGQTLWWTLSSVLLASWCLMLSSASIGVCMEHWIKQRLTPKRQRDVKAVTAILLGPTILLFVLALIGHSTWYWRWVLDFHQVLINFPPFQLMASIYQEPSQAWPGLLCFVIVAAVAMLVSVRITELNFAKGLNQHSGFEAFRQSTSDKTVGQSAIRKSSRWQFLLDRLPLMAWREAILLGRDRNYLAQVIGIPIMMIFVQIFLSGSRDSVLDSQSLYYLWTFFVPGILIFSSSTMLLIREHDGLWQLATAAKPLNKILAERQFIWIALAYSLCLIMAFVFHGPNLMTKPEPAFRLLLTLLAIWMLEQLCRSISLFFYDPFRVSQKKGPPVLMLYLLFSLSSVFSWAVAFASPWQSVVALTLLFGLTLAFKQKAHEYEPFILDPIAAPPAQASLSDGLIAALIYFLLQSFIFAVSTFIFASEFHSALVWSTIFAGLMSFLTFRLYYYWRQARHIPQFLGPFTATDGLIFGIIFGTLLLVASKWLEFAPGWKIWEYFMPGVGAEVWQRKLDVDFSLFLLICLVAPFAEEFLFRGLIFGGMKRYIGSWPAIALSSLIFAIVHPPFSFVPVFLMGAGAAYLYHRSNSLILSVFLHMVYNGAVLIMN